MDQGAATHGPDGRERRLRGFGVRVQERLLHRNVQWFRGGLVFKAHRIVYNSSRGSRVIKKKKVLGTASARSVGAVRVLTLLPLRWKSVKCLGILLLLFFIALNPRVE